MLYKCLVFSGVLAGLVLCYFSKTTATFYVANIFMRDKRVQLKWFSFDVYIIKAGQSVYKTVTDNAPQYVQTMFTKIKEF